MAQMSLQSSHSPTSVPKRPKGILKKTGSYQQASPDARISPTSEQAPNHGSHDAAVHAGQSGSRPGMPPRQMSEKEITQMNTETNTGGRHRNSSNPRGSISRRQSSQLGENGSAGEHPDNEMRLKWDEANLYVNESQMGGRMKIDEPKTPFAKSYDPAEDEEEIETINAEELAVDELEMDKARPKARKTSDIPGLDLGEPEMEPSARRESDGERRVHVDPDQTEQDGAGHGEQNEEDMTREEREKHKKFEEMRKKHYEMKNIKSLLGHSEDLDALDDDDEK